MNHMAQMTAAGFLAMPLEKTVKTDQNCLGEPTVIMNYHEDLKYSPAYIIKKNYTHCSELRIKSSF